MATSRRGAQSSLAKGNKRNPPENEINILLLGQTGVGKTTFINAFANYLTYDTLDDAIKGDMQVVIPSSFSFTDPETFEAKSFTVGDENSREKIDENGQTGTPQCRSYCFPIGNRNFRLIDTPGMGDTRGSEQDNQNFFEILTYISHYEYLNGICIFLKPNEERLTIAFRLCIKQVLHYLHASASENIIFIFTNARSTFFTPGSSKKLLQVLLNEHREKNQTEIPFARDNTFLLDNEPFRYLAIHQNNIGSNKEQRESYEKSWDHTVKEYQRLFTYISKCPLHGVAHILSLNAAEQLIRKLARPVAETHRLIQQNIQLAKERKQELQTGQGNTKHGFYQNLAQISPLEHPKLVCISKHCLPIVNPNNQTKPIQYRTCQEDSYLSGVIQETMKDSRIAECEVMDSQTSECKKCGCSWKRHMNMTYEYHIRLRHDGTGNSDDENKDYQSIVNSIDQHVTNLEKEQATIEDAYRKLSKFLHINAIHPFNDNIIDYLHLFVFEEQMKKKEGVRNDDVINNLTKIVTQYQHDIDCFKRTLSNGKDSNNATADVIKVEEVFSTSGDLYHLPINGQLIRHTIQSLESSEDRAIERMEKTVGLPEKTVRSTLMDTLVNIDSERF